MEIVESKRVPLQDIKRGKWDFRQEKSVDRKLMANIRSNGLQEHLWLEEDLTLLEGHRRHLALCELAKEDSRFSHVPAIILQGTDDELAKLIGVKHELIKRYGEKTRGELVRHYLHVGLAVDDVTELLGLSAGYASDLSRMSERSDLWEAIMGDKIDIGHGRHLLRLPEKRIPEALARVVQEGLSVAQTKDLVQKLRSPDLEVHRQFGKEVTKRIKEEFPEARVSWTTESDQTLKVTLKLSLPQAPELAEHDAPMPPPKDLLEKGVHELQQTLSWPQIEGWLDRYEVALSQKQRESLQMYFEEQKTLAEIAGNLGTVRGTVSNHLKRALKTILRKAQELES